MKRESREENRRKSEGRNVKEKKPTRDCVELLAVLWTQESSRIMESEALQKYQTTFISLSIDKGRSKQFQTFI